MAIQIQCGNCQTTMRVSDEWAGKSGKCKSCGNLVQVPSAPEPHASQPIAPVQQPAEQQPPEQQPAEQSAAGQSPAGQPSYEQAHQQVMGRFTGEIEPVRLPASYRFGVLLVALVMVLLPLIYIGLIVLAGYGIYYHSVNHTGIFQAARGGRSGFFAVLIYIAPMVIGGILVAFMIKPLFSRPPKPGRRRSLTRDGEPLLFTFVDRICDAVRAPKPKRIDLDCQVNASASFRRGMLSFLGNDLVLTIGMPLVAGLSVRQFGGVLAHEFGHFSQGAGMRLTYVIRSIAFWFQRVVYERDSWDQWLHESARSIDFRIGWILFLAQFFVWVTRKILYVLMLVGYAVGGFLLRQMEFDADRYEARLAGSDAFESTARKLPVLGVAYQGAQSDLGQFYSEGRLADNLPRLIEYNVGELPKDLHEAITKSIDESKTGIFDTHPCDRERIANAHREESGGILQVNLPARALFRDFDASSRNVTWDFYSEIFGSRLKPDELHPIGDLLERQQKEQEATKSLVRFFQGEFQHLRPYEISDLQAIEASHAKHVAERLRDARQAMLDGLPTFKQREEHREQQLSTFLQCQQVLQLIDAGLRPAKGFECPTDSNGATKALGESQAQLTAVSQSQAEWDAVASQRLGLALSLLFYDGLASKIENVAIHRQRVSSLMPAARQLCEFATKHVSLRIEISNLAVLANNLEGNGEDQTFINSILGRMDAVFQATNELREAFRGMRYPLDHAEANITVAEFLLKEPLLDNQDLGAIYEGTEGLLDNYCSLTARVMAHLTLAAEKVESALGLPPLPEPDLS